MLLNLDAGEYDDEPETLWALADILAVACGGHAGDPDSMSRLAAFVARSPRRTALGAHPSYPDREAFGRQVMEIEPARMQTHVAAQCRALAAAAAANGIAVHYVKPHGALYHQATHDRLLANAIVDGALEGLFGSADDDDGELGSAVGTAIDDGALGSTASTATDEGDPASSGRRTMPTSRSALTFIGPSIGAFADAVRIRGLTYLREGFADRAIRPDGSLVPRSEPGALITDPVAAVSRARELVGHVDTICVHGDSPGAVDIARAVRTMLDRKG